MAEPYYSDSAIGASITPCSNPDSAAKARDALRPNAFTARISPIVPFDHRSKPRVLRVLPATVHPFARIGIEPSAQAAEAAVRRFGMRKAAI